MTHKTIYASTSTIPSKTANSVHVMKMCQAMKESGVPVMLLAPLRSNAETVNNLWEHYGVRSQFPIHWLKATKLLRELDYGLRAAWFAKKSGAQVFFTRHVPTAWAAHFFIPKVYLELHDPNFGPGSKRMFAAMLGSKSLTKVIVISSALKKILMSEFKINPDKIQVEPDAVDAKAFFELPELSQAKRGLGIDPSQKVAGYAGHLYAGRGVELVLALAKRHPEVLFLIAGGRPEDVSKYEALSTGLKNVRFLGFVLNQKLPAVLAACDFLLMPYQRKLAVSGGNDTAQWMSPMKMFEYMATGRPILSSDLPALREILNERNSQLCDPDSEDAWSQGLMTLLEKPDLARALASQAKSDVAEYTWEKRVRRILTS